MSEELGGHEALTEQIIACAIRLHDSVGPGLLESLYERCLVIELESAGLLVQAGRRVPLVYRGRRLDAVFVPDLIVEDAVVVEVKTVERLMPVHIAQLVTYLRLTGCPVGLLLNFHVQSMRAGVRRVIRPDLYRQRYSAKLRAMAPDRPGS